MVDFATPETSGSNVLILQEKMNQLLGSGSVKETGDFDKKTVEQLKSVQQTLGLPATGIACAATMKAIDKGISQRGWYIVTYGGTQYQLNEAEYQLLVKKSREKLAREMETFVKLANEAELLWKSHGQSRSQHVMGKVVEVYAGASYPDASVISASTKAAKGLVAKAKSGGAINLAADTAPIAAALKAIGTYRKKIYDGGEDLVGKLTTLRNGCVLVLEIGAAIGTAGASTTVTVGVATGMGAYKGLLGGMDKAGGKKMSGITIGKEVFKGAAIDGAVSLIMKNQTKGFEKFTDDIAKKAVEKYAKDKSKAAVTTYAINAINGGTKNAVEESLKKMANLKAADKPVTRADLEQAAIEGFVKGAFLEGVASSAKKYYDTNAGKHFDGSDFVKQSNKIDPAKAYSEGLKKVVDQSTTAAVDKAMQDLTPKEAKKAEEKIRQCTMNDPQIAAWVKAYERKQK